MPCVITGAGKSVNGYGLVEADYGYSYPGGLKLKPGTTEHDTLKERILERAQESRSTMGDRYDQWRKIDRTLTAYIAADDEESIVKNNDPRKPISIVIPVSYAAMETLLTYYTTTLLEDPIFKYEGAGPEDVIGALLLEKVIDLHCKRHKVALNLHTMFRDSIAYGFGVVTPYWERTYRQRSVTEPRGFFDSIGRFISQWAATTQVDVACEGNAIKNIDPYMYLPDPNVSIHEVQSGEYVGWVNRTNRFALLSQEKNDGDMFNAKYLQHIDGRSTYYRDMLGTGRTKDDGFGGSGTKTSPVDLIYMYINLIPNEWKLGPGEYPEKWMFCLAGDQILLKAQPLGLDHNMFPVAVAAPNYDGYSVAPTSTLEILYGMQEVTDWEVNVHVKTQRKAMNEMLVVDPSMIYMKDLENPAPGKLIRARRSAWGKDLSSAINQLRVVDVTQNNISDVAYLSDMIQRVSGATDAVQGVMRSGGERRSATESRNTFSSALSRLEKSVRIIGLQALIDLGDMFASHTQQMMTSDVYIKTVGRLEEQLRMEYGLGEQVLVSPKDISVNYDVVSFNNSTRGGEFADIWVQLFQIMSTNPQIGMQFDMVRIFKHIGRLMGARNMDDFVARNGMVPQIVPDEQAASMAQAGNIVPIGGTSDDQTAGGAY